MPFRSLSAFSTVAFADLASARMCRRSVWKCEKAVSTVFTASAISCACALHGFAEEEAEEEGEALGDAVALCVGEGEAVATWVGDALALADAEADGLAFTWVVIVTVATPFDTVAVRSTPVVPMRKIPAKTPDFAWKNSSSRRSNMGEPSDPSARTSKPRPLLGGVGATLAADGEDASFLAVFGRRG